MFGYGENFLHMIKITFTSIQYKTKINNLSSDPFVQYFPIFFRRSKGIQIGDHDIKIVNFAANTSIVLRDISSLNSLQVILKLYGHRASSSKVNFSKAHIYGLEHMKIELNNQDTEMVTVFH